MFCAFEQRVCVYDKAIRYEMNNWSLWIWYFAWKKLYWFKNEILVWIEMWPYIKKDVGMNKFWKYMWKMPVWKKWIEYMSKLIVWLLMIGYTCMLFVGMIWLDQCVSIVYEKRRNVNVYTKGVSKLWEVYRIIRKRE